MPDFEPSDWKNTKIPRLAQLDSLQRCLICKDFLKAPVITSCNHTFCSQCIRQHLMSVNRCPLCKTEQFESNLKRVILLEELVLCFQSLRDDLISIVASHNDNSSETRVQEKSRSLAEGKKVEVIEIPDESETSEEPRYSGLGSNHSKQQKLEPGYVHCPVCQEVMKEEHVQGSHLDYCLKGKPDPKLAPKNPPAKRRKNDVLSFFQDQKRQKKVAASIDHEKFYFNQGDKHHHDTKRIPKVDFASLSTAKSKEKLAALKLPTMGSRAELEWRYNQYYLLHQSNLDSNHPLSEMELRQKLKKWEVSHSATPAAISSNTIYGDSLSRKSLSDKDFPIKAWLELYKDEFKRLVKQARKSRKLQRPHKSKCFSEQPNSVKNNNGAREVDSTPTDGTCDTPEISCAESKNIDFKTENNKGNRETTGLKSNETEDPETNEIFDFTKSTLFAPE
ncbi:hypothetical protein JCM33374_g3017 [Metschnikowia sp. JCM 33374]|nr:hypothetical protein JCM33374_g3017 [Metschnikowia sp. JCM 33374]